MNNIEKGVISEIDSSLDNETYNKAKLSKLIKRAWKGEINTIENWIDCIYHSIKGVPPSIEWNENKNMKDCLHDVNITDLRDLIYHFLGVKQQINNSFRVCVSYCFNIFKITPF